MILAMIMIMIMVVMVMITTLTMTVTFGEEQETEFIAYLVLLSLEYDDNPPRNKPLRPDYWSLHR